MREVSRLDEPAGAGASLAGEGAVEGENSDELSGAAEIEDREAAGDAVEEVVGAWAMATTTTTKIRARTTTDWRAILKRIRGDMERRMGKMRGWRGMVLYMREERGEGKWMEDLILKIYKIRVLMNFNGEEDEPIKLLY